MDTIQFFNTPKEKEKQGNVVPLHDLLVLQFPYDVSLSWSKNKERNQSQVEKSSKENNKVALRWNPFCFSSSTLPVWQTSTCQCPDTQKTSTTAMASWTTMRQFLTQHRQNCLSKNSLHTCMQKRQTSTLLKCLFSPMPFLKKIYKKIHLDFNQSVHEINDSLVLTDEMN